MTGNRLIICKKCKQNKIHKGLGLCKACHSKFTRDKAGKPNYGIKKFLTYKENQVTMTLRFDLIKCIDEKQKLARKVEELELELKEACEKGG